MKVLPMRLERALVRRPHTDEELADIIAEFDQLIHDLEDHQIQLSREWLRKYPRKGEDE